MKYRIKQKGDLFYPQRKSFLFWCGYKGEPYRYWNGVLEMYQIDYHDLFFNSYDKAKDFITKEKHNNKIVYHKII